MKGLNGAATPREKQGAKREGAGSAGARGWVPLTACLRPLHSALVGVRGWGRGGGSRADVTAGRARPRRRRWEPLRETREATHCQEPPHRCHGARLPRLSLCVRPGRGAWRAPEPGVSPGTRQMRGSGAAVPAAAPPPPLPHGAPAPFPDTLQSQKTERRSGALVEECQAIKSDHHVFMRKVNDDETPLQKQIDVQHSDLTFTSLYEMIITSLGILRIKESKLILSIEPWEHPERSMNHGRF
ncbi:uncharacterized protein LOC117018767 [Rhinolophus ferrumequinum]|uniref:uncharacterized protein LOC117018767 n=1 Tax=Rhinolophus ferrumequinum TaxID=59479 RepID=UPI00140F9237|nr:uncharacterized protein LOC117018767 [Rhinolophus ferrumequinum]